MKTAQRNIQHSNNVDLTSRIGLHKNIMLHNKFTFEERNLHWA